MSHTTIHDNIFGNIKGGFLSHNTTTTINIYAASSGPSNLSRHGRGYMPASTILFGRDPDVDFIVEHLIWKSETAESKRARFAILGTGGMGKTSVALKVVRDARLLACYSEYYQAWLPCIQATSFTLLLDIIHSALDLPSSNKNTLNAILDLLRSSKPIILLFDNFETPWNAPGARGEVAQFLRDIDAIPHVAIFLTMRATVPPCEEIKWTEMRIQPLDPAASFQLYTEIDTKAGDDEKLSELLEMLGHMPLAVKLMARQGNSTGCTVKQLIESYHKTGTAMLGPSGDSDAQNSVSISISLSLESPQVKRESDAYELLSRISMLPAGTTFQALQTLWAPHINLQSALQALLDTSLLEHSTGTYFVLPVIRSHVLDPSRFPRILQHSLVEAACSFLAQHSSAPGDAGYKDDMIACSIEEMNLQAILLHTTSLEPDYIQALLTLAWHQYRIRPRTEVISHAVRLVRQVKDQKLVGDILHSYGSIIRHLNHFKEALGQCQLARQAYLVASEHRLAALALLNIAYISVLLDSQTDEIPLIQQAQHELATIQKSKPHQRRHGLSSLSAFREWLTRSVSLKPKATYPVDQDDMATCLRDLGRAYLRRGDHSNAIRNLISARALCPELSFNGTQCAQSLALSYHRLQQHNEAEKWGLLALREWREMGGHLGYILRILGRIYISKGHYEQAIAHLSEGLQLAKARDNQWNTADILLELGRAYIKKRGSEDAQACFTEALVHFGKLEGTSESMIACRFYLAQIDDSFRAPTEVERHALQVTWHTEDIPHPTLTTNMLMAVL